MRILIDTDVLLDVALEREPHVVASAHLLDALEQGHAQGFVTSHSIATFYYLLDSSSRGATPVDMIRDLLQFLEVASLDKGALLRATRLPLKDFEDAMQVAAAHAAGCDMIATRNTKDFKKSAIDASTPEAVLSAIE